MLSFIKTGSVTITCNKRLTPSLAQEVTELGYGIDETYVTGLRLQASLEDCMRLNMSLRCASQVLYRLKAFTAADSDDVYKAVNTVAWEKILPANGYFSVTGNVFNDTVTNTLYPNLRVKDAIVDRLRTATGSRPDTGSGLRGAVVHLYWKDQDAELFLDTSGESLARHGYRKLPGRAPMLEALASAVILSTRWDRKSSFINPMCGSGTLAIEAALIATHTAPGLFRDNYAFMHLLGFDEAAYLKIRGALENQIVEAPGLRIIATDHSVQAIGQAKKNAQAAGVSDLIHFGICDFTQTEIPAGGQGIMVVNPEYGERMGEVAELEHTYTAIGDFMKQKCGGYYGYVFTGNPDLAKKIGLKAKRKVEFYTGAIDARLLEYELYAGSKRGA